MKYIPSIVLYSIFIISCSNQPRETTNTNLYSGSDTASMIRNFIYGLWSLDSDQNLCNEGYYLLPGGVMNLVASEEEGNWELVGLDSIKLIFTSYRAKARVECAKIDSLSADRMVLMFKDGRYVFRKVPFGANPEGIILSGFMGTLIPGNEKEYSFTLPAAKKIKIELLCDHPDVVFRVYDEHKELTFADVKNWEAIIIQGGKYHAKVKFSERKSTKPSDVEFNLKIIGY